jgi:hypothetical protein
VTFAATSTAPDFSRSAVTWLLADPPSYGRFALDAVLTVKAETYVLGAQVFAGNVYSSGELFKDPPFRFSAAFGGARFRIFRDAARGEPLQDTEGSSDRAFGKIKVDVVRQGCRAIAPEALAERPFIANAGLTARIRIQPGAASRPQEIEFPVRHINVNPRTRGFQVETGPLLLDWGNEAEASGRLRRAFVMFNSLRNAEFLVDAVRPSVPGRSWSERLSVPCEVSLLEAEDLWTATKPA